MKKIYFLKGALFKIPEIVQKCQVKARPFTVFINWALSEFPSDRHRDTAKGGQDLEKIFDQWLELLVLA